jgi:hypothetical protein
MMPMIPYAHPDASRWGRKQKPPREALARPPNAAALPMGPSLDLRADRDRPAFSESVSSFVPDRRFRQFRKKHQDVEHQNAEG